VSICFSAVRTGRAVASAERCKLPHAQILPDDAFLKAYPAYASTDIIDRLRRSEYARLDRGEHVYLDYTGGGLYAESQLRQHQELLSENVFGNPHSTNPTSLAATELIDGARTHILRFFNADPDEYLAVFTANASGALKLVGESYPFKDGRYLLTFDYHNSVNGIRAFAHARGAEVTYIPIALPDMRLDASTSTSSQAADARSQPVCVPGPVQLLRASSTRSSGSGRPRLAAGVAADAHIRAHKQTGPGRRKT
jgi:selenocysteine lyase/cysteine desulfurase